MKTIEKHSLPSLTRLAKTATMTGDAASSSYTTRSGEHKDESDLNGTASTPFITPVCPPIFRSMDPLRVAAFLKEREPYEMDINIKAPQVPSLRAAPFTVCVDRALLRNLIYMRKLEK